MLVWLHAGRAFAPIPVLFDSFAWVKFIWLEWSGSAIVIVALIYCDLYVHFATQTRKRLEVAHWTITTWLFYETTVAHRCDTKPIHKLNANPSHQRTSEKKIQEIQHILSMWTYLEWKTRNRIIFYCFGFAFDCRRIIVNTKFLRCAEINAYNFQTILNRILNSFWKVSGIIADWNPQNISIKLFCKLEFALI